MNEGLNFNLDLPLMRLCKRLCLVFAMSSLNPECHCEGSWEVREFAGRYLGHWTVNDMWLGQDCDFQTPSATFYKYLAECMLCCCRFILQDNFHSNSCCVANVLRFSLKYFIKQNEVRINPNKTKKG